MERINEMNSFFSEYVGSTVKCLFSDMGNTQVARGKVTGVEGNLLKISSEYGTIVISTDRILKLVKRND